MIESCQILFFFFIKNANRLVLNMNLEHCSVFMRGTFCALPYGARFKLLNNGNVVGFRLASERS